MYDYYMERMWARQEEEEHEAQLEYDLRAYEAQQEREYKEWLEEQYFAALEAEEYENYRAAD